MTGKQMKQMSVKEYAKLIGKNEKTVYRMIREESIVAVKEKGKLRINVDKNLLRVIDRAQQALEEAKTILLNIEKASEQIMKPDKGVLKTAQSAAKKSVPKKKAITKSTKSAAKPVKRTVKKAVKPLKNSAKSVQKKGK